MNIITAEGNGKIFTLTDNDQEHTPVTGTLNEIRDTLLNDWYGDAVRKGRAFGRVVSATVNGMIWTIDHNGDTSGSQARLGIKIVEA